MVAEHATEEEIKTALEKVCHLLPSRSQEKCKEIVDQYGSLIIHLLFSAITPEQICKEIRLCTDTAQGKSFVFLVVFFFLITACLFVLMHEKNLFGIILWGKHVT